IGYRRGARGGTWIARHYSGDRKPPRLFHPIGTADDVVDADGVHVFSFAQAQEGARKWFAELARQDSGKPSGPFTVKGCVDDYLTWFESHRKDARNTRYRAEALILPALGDVDCNKLTTRQLEKWLHDLASSPALLRSRKGTEKQNTREFDKSDPEAVR